MNLHTDPVPKDVAKYHKRHLFSLMSNRQKILFIMSFLYPYPEDAEVLPLPKHLAFFIFSLTSFFMGMEKNKEACIVIGGSRNGKYIIFHKENTFICWKNFIL